MVESSLGDVVRFIRRSATDEDVQLIYKAIRRRSEARAQVRASKVRVGQRVRLARITPKFINGLQGDIINITGTSMSDRKAEVSLTEASAKALRYHPRNISERFFIRTPRYTVRVPLSCCDPVGEPSTAKDIVVPG